MVLLMYDYFSNVGLITDSSCFVMKFGMFPQNTKTASSFPLLVLTFIYLFKIKEYCCIITGKNVYVALMAALYLVLNLILV